MHTFNPNANDGFKLPSNLRRTKPEDFQFKTATGLALYWNDEGTHKFGFCPLEDNVIRFFGGTASPNSTVPGYLQSLMWMHSRGYDLQPTSVLGFRVLHRLHTSSPLMEGLTAIPHYEEHGIIPVNRRFDEWYPNTVWVWMDDNGHLTASQPGVRWANDTIAEIAMTIIETVTIAQGDTDRIHAFQQVMQEGISRNQPVPLNG